MSQLVFFSLALLFWSVATASRHVDMCWSAWRSSSDTVPFWGPVPRATVMAAAILVAGWSLHGSGIMLAALAAVGVLLLFRLRGEALRKGRLADLEIGALILWAGLSGVIIHVGKPHVGTPFLHPDVSRSHGIAICLAASGLIIAVWQSGNIVRGILQKVQVAPRAEVEAASPTSSGLGEGSGGRSEASIALRQGWLIGYLERLLIVVLVVEGSYEGLGFLIAAKGLIRAREFEDKTLAE